MARRNPERLSEKLLAVRTALGLSQRGLIRRMGLEGELTQAEVSMYESGRRQLLGQVQLVAHEHIHPHPRQSRVLAQDEQPGQPARPTSAGVERKRAGKS